MATLTQCNTQWRSRPADERFTSLIELNDFTHAVRRNSISRVVSSRALTVQPADDNQGLLVAGPNGVPVAPTHHAFGQLAQRAGAPAGYLRELPAPIAADALNWGLKFNRDIQDIQVLLRKDETGGATLQAATGPNYGRIYNSTITEALVRQFGDGLTGDFRVPGEWGKQVVVTKDNTTLYAGDRDMFVFLADEEHRIEIPNRRDGQTGSVARGFFCYNSEVGSSTFGIATFTFDFVCGNRLVWNAQGFEEMKIRHTAGAPDRWIEEARPALDAYARSSTKGFMEALENARAARVDDANEFLAKRFSKRLAGMIEAAHMADEQRPMENLYDVSNGITAYARGVQYQDERVALEREAGKVFALAA
jgi:hypothetical protein